MKAYKVDYNDMIWITGLLLHILTQANSTAFQCANHGATIQHPFLAYLCPSCSKAYQTSPNNKLKLFWIHGILNDTHDFVPVISKSCPTHVATDRNCLLFMSCNHRLYFPHLMRNLCGVKFF